MLHLFQHLKRATLQKGIAGSFGVAIAGIAIYAGNYRPLKAESRQVLSIMCYNVLARSFTKHSRRFHRAPQVVEDDVQTRARYALAGNQILEKASDIILLQECDHGFFEANMNPAAPDLIRLYDVFACRQDTSPGTAIMMKKDGVAVAEGKYPVCIGGTEDTGGRSKIATLVQARLGNTHLTAISAHFAYEGAAAKRQHHVDLLGDALAKTSGLVVLGGDFNCQAGDNLNLLESRSFLQDLSRVLLPEGAVTYAGVDMATPALIDHVYASRDFSVADAQVIGKLGNPWGGMGAISAEVTGASDHVPIYLQLVN